MRKRAGNPLARRQWLQELGTGMLIGSVACTGLLPVYAAPSRKKDKEKKAAGVQDTLILVTAFAETGQTLRGARVWLYPGDAAGNIIKGKSVDGQTNNMGEIPFHVPKTEAHYVLVAEEKGFERTQKQVSVRGEDQLDVFLQLPPSR